MTKPGTMRANIFFVNAACMDTAERICSKDTNQSVKANSKGQQRQSCPRNGRTRGLSKTIISKWSHRSWKTPTLRKIQGCEPSPDKSYTVKMEKHKVCGYSYIIARSAGETYGPCIYRGEDATFKFLADILQREIWLRSLMANKKQLVMAPADLKNTKNATDCHIWGKSLFKEVFLDSIFCAWPQLRPLLRPKPQKMLLWGNEKNELQWSTKRKERKIPPWPVDCNNQGTCLFCAEYLLVQDYKNSVRNHCHITGKYRGAAHNQCNFKRKLNPKTVPIPVVAHNLKYHDVHLLM